MEAATKQFKKRNAILSCLRGTVLHPSAEMVHEMLREEHPDISLATIYRNLALFKSQGLIQSVGTVNGSERFPIRQPLCLWDAPPRNAPAVRYTAAS